jgi:predicted phosphodiesterase
MKISAVSDIHGSYNAAQLDEAVREMKNSDAVVVAGDLTENINRYEAILQKFNGINGLKVAVLGNHDLYAKRDEDSYAKIGLLDEVCRRNDFHLLDSAPVVKDGVGFVGNIGWYDYQFAQKEPDCELIVNNAEWRGARLSQMTDEDFSVKDYVFFDGETLSRGCWNDGNYINWQFSDKDFLRMQVDKLGEDMDRVSDEVDKIVYVSHHIPIDEFVYKRSDDSKWSLFNAYQGSPELGEVAFSNPKLELLITGHSHIPDFKRVGNVPCYNVSYELGKLKPVFMEV